MAARSALPGTTVQSRSVPHRGLAAGSLIWLLALLASCQRAPAQSGLGALPLAYLEFDAAHFERYLAQRFPNAEARALPAEELDALALALSRHARIATKAALVLARSKHPQAARVLLARLEQRVLGPERWSDGGDLTAAAALARMPVPADTDQRLLALCLDPNPHPDLEVRTECALSALALGSDQALPYLLRVLRIDTPSAAREGALTDSATTAWPRGRAAEALCREVGEPYRDWTDNSLEEREAQADRLEALLAERLAQLSPR